MPTGVQFDTVIAHETAVVESGATIGDETRVWHHAHVRTGAHIGARCVLGKNVFVDSGAVIGDGVKVQNNVSVYQGVTLGDDVFVGPHVTFTNDRWPRASSTEWEVVPTMVQQGASIGGGATVVCGVTIGAFATVGAGSVVTRDVLPHQLVVGNPAHHHGWVCDCGRLASRATDAPTDLTCDECRASVS